jgi:tRNA(fMet)-specific endonuclease VapC
MIILDTDHISLLQWGGEAGYRIQNRLGTLGLGESHPTTIITYEEQMRGWVSEVKKAKTLFEEIEMYAILK